MLVGCSSAAGSPAGLEPRSNGADGGAAASTAPSPDASAADSPTDAGPAGAVACAAKTTVGDPRPVGAYELVRGKLYVVFSEITQTDRASWIETSNTYVIRGVAEDGGTAVWIFGSGYGDGKPLATMPYPRTAQAPSRTGAVDASDADGIIRGCLGLTPSQARLRFVAPHYHFDHFNFDFIGGLLSHGYSLDQAKLWIHAADYTQAFCGAGCTGNGGSLPAFPPELQAKTTPIGNSGDTCGTEVGGFDTDGLGHFRIVSDPGHTPGTISLAG